MQTFERDLPGANGMGFNTTTIGALPLEMSETMNDSWGFKLTDRNWRSARDLVRGLVNAAGRNANFLLNVGPRPDGTFPAEATARLVEIGKWMTINAESVYGTRGGPIAPRPWGVTTQKGDTVYVHIMDGSDKVLALPPLPKPISSARMLSGGAVVAVQSSPSGVMLSLPARDPQNADQVVKLVLKSP